MRIGIYPGSFDPLTYGHLDIIERATKICDRLIVGILVNSAKKSMFSLEERMDCLKQCCKTYDTVEVISFSGLLVDFCRQNAINCIIRGLRAVSDFEYEIQISSMNKIIQPTVKTVFFTIKSLWAKARSMETCNCSN